MRMGPDIRPGAALAALRERAPLIHLITNFVTVNDCANVVLAAGASPTMARHPEEAAEITAAAAALVCNLGAAESGQAMVLAVEKAGALGHPVVLDPVAVGASSLRRRLAGRLLDTGAVTVIRGNASEIRALALDAGAGSGVDAAPEDLVTEAGLGRAAELAGALARRTGTVVALSGPLDLVTDGARTFVGRNGCPEMARVTGSGCMLSALTGAFCAALPDRPLEAALAAVSALGVSGERAEGRRLANGTGNATFRNDLIDGVELLTPDILEQEARYDTL